MYCCCLLYTWSYTTLYICNWLLVFLYNDNNTHIHQVIFWIPKESQHDPKIYPVLKFRKHWFCIVKTMTFELPRVPETPNLHHFEHLFFCMRFGRHFLQNLANLGSHWGPFGVHLGALFGNFWGVFSGPDFGRFLRYFLEGPATGAGSLKP